MTPRSFQVHRYLMLPIPLLITGCCTFKNPSVYFSTGTTVGLEATPPVNQTPPTITFGYKRVELALLPVPEPGKQMKRTSFTAVRGCTEQPSPAQNGEESRPATLPKTAEPSPSGAALDESKESELSTGEAANVGSRSTPATSNQTGTTPNLKSEDAYSVLAVFNLALNWFGPAKIEQHFVTGCAASHLVSGLTQAEEDKRGAQEAQSDSLAAKQQAITTDKKVNDLRNDATQAQKDAEKAKELSNDASEEAKKATDKSSFDAAKKKAEKADLDAQKTLDKIAELLAGADQHNDNLAEAKEKANSAIQSANRALRSEEARAKAVKAKEDAENTLAVIKVAIPSVKQKVDDVTSRLKSAQELARDARAMASAVRKHALELPPSK